MDALSSTQAPDDRQTLCEALARVSAGSQQGLQEVYARTSAKLFGICLRILGDKSEAEDALQEVYIKVWHRAGGFDPARASPVTWLAVIARNSAVDRLRSGRRMRDAAPIEAAANVADSAASALDQLAGSEERGRLMACVEQLEARQAATIREAFFGGFTYTELASRSAVPLGTVKSWVRRGLLRLRECLER